LFFWNNKLSVRYLFVLISVSCAFVASDVSVWRHLTPMTHNAPMIFFWWAKVAARGQGSKALFHDSPLWHSVIFFYNLLNI
jgi:hypothetical protein